MAAGIGVGILSGPRTLSKIGGTGGYRRARLAQRDSSEEEIEFDEKKSVSECVNEALKNLVTKSGVTKGKKLGYLNALVKMWEKREAESDPSIRLKEILLCFRIPLTHESAEVRAATLRTVRCLLRSESAVTYIEKVNMHFLIARCVDIDLDNAIERLHALRLARKMLFLEPKKFPDAIIRSVVAVAHVDFNIDDKLKRICLAMLCELSLLNPEKLIACGGISALTHAVLDCSMPKMNEAILGSLLRLLNLPSIRCLTQIHLGFVVAPFTEFRYVHDDIQYAGKGLAANESEIEMSLRFTCARLAILSLLRSWPGLVQMANPNRGGVSPLKSLIDVLNLKNTIVRDHVIAILFEALGFSQPKETDDVEEALRSSDPSHFRDEWKLAEGFVAAEGLHILPNRIRSRPNLRDSHRSLLLWCLMKVDLANALINVIITSETKSQCISATVLLGEFLHALHVFLPRELNITSHCLPALLASVISSEKNIANSASVAVCVLQTLFKRKKMGILANSPFLDDLMSKCDVEKKDELAQFHDDRATFEKSQDSKKPSLLLKSLDERIGSCIDESRVLLSHDALVVWRWDFIATVFCCPGEAFLTLESSNSRQFVRSVADFFKPSNTTYAKMELRDPVTKYLTKVGCHFVNFLVSSKAPEAARILDEFVSDIKYQLNQISSSSSPHECLFSPTRVASTACQYYFLFIGKLSHSLEGRKRLDKHEILASFDDLSSISSDLYIKLAITCLDYSSEIWGARQFLTKTLQEASETRRIYATKFLGLMMRCKCPRFDKWGIELLITQLEDASKIIPWIAMDILEETCDTDSEIIEAVAQKIHIKEIKRRLGFQAICLEARFLAASKRFKHAVDNHLLEEYLDSWAKEYNVRYVAHVEDIINDGFTRHQHTDEREYGRRSHEGHKTRTSYVPWHLYGQLAMSEEGLKILKQEKAIKDMIENLLSLNIFIELNEAEEVVNLKAIIWAICHIASTPDGVRWCIEKHALRVIVRLAEESSLLGVRGTALYALGLVAMTKEGVNFLETVDWSGIQHTKDERWPIWSDWFVKRFFDLQKEWNISVDLEDESEDHHIVPSDLTPDNSSMASGSGDDRNKSSSRRKRLSKLFRSFSLSHSQERRRNSAKTRRRMFKHASINVEVDSPDGPPEIENPASTPIRERNADKENACERSDVKDNSKFNELVNIDEEIPSANLDELAEAKIQLSEDTIRTKQRSELEKESEKSSKPIPEITHSVAETSMLSPIPSVTSINTLKSPSIVQDTRPSENKTLTLPSVKRGTRSGVRAFSESDAGPAVLKYSKNVSGFPSIGISSSGVGRGHSHSSVASSSSSWTDSPAYHTLRSLKNRQRPLLMHGETQDHSKDGCGEFHTSSPSSNRLLPPWTDWSRKSRSLDYKLTRAHRAYASLPRSKTLSVGSKSQISSHIIESECEEMKNELYKGKFFWGIALPNIFEALFPVEPDRNIELWKSNDEKEESPEQESREAQIVNDWLQRHHIPSSQIGSFHGLEFHTINSCLGCLRITHLTNVSELHPEAHNADRRRSGSVSIPCAESHAEGSSFRDDTDIGSASDYYSPFSNRRFRKESIAESEDSYGGNTCGSTHSLRSDSESKVAHHETIVSRIIQRREVLRLIGLLQSSVLAKQAEQRLLKLKQRHPTIFQDLCLYSDIMVFLSSFSFRLSARRFIQELFMNLNYEDLYVEPYKILGMDDTASQLSQVTEMTSDENIFSSPSNQRVQKQKC